MLGLCNRASAGGEERLRLMVDNVETWRREKRNRCYRAGRPKRTRVQHSVLTVEIIHVVFHASGHK